MADLGREPRRRGPGPSSTRSALVPGPLPVAPRSFSHAARPGCETTSLLSGLWDLQPAERVGTETAPVQASDRSPRALRTTLRPCGDWKGVSLQ